MATIYVNNSGSAQTGPSGSWGVGSDANPGTSISAPKETFSAALTAASNGDTVLIWDGVYDDGDYTLASKTGLNVEAENPWAVTIQNNNASDDRVFAGNSVTDNIRFGKVIIDAEGKDHCYRSSGTGTTSRFILDGTRLINFAEEAWRNHGTTVFTGQYLIQSTQLDGTTTTSGVRFDPDTSGQTIIFGGRGVINVTGGPTGTLNGVYITPDAAVDNTNVYLCDGLTINVEHDNDSTVVAAGARIGVPGVSAGFGTVYIGKINVNITGSDSPIGAQIVLDTTLALDKLIINKPEFRNRSFGTIAVSGGYGLSIGDEFDQAGGDTIGSRLLTAIEYDSPYIYGFDHGEYSAGFSNLSYGRGAKIERCVLSRIMEGCDNVALHSGFVINPDNAANGQCLRIKECTNSIQEQNTVYISDVAYLGTCIEERDSTTSSTGNTFRNNNIILPEGLTGSPVIVNRDETATSGATFENNHYYKGGDSFVSGEFKDGLTDYDFAGWVSNVESTAISSAQNGTRADGKISDNSSLIGAGSTSSETEYDYNGLAFNVIRRTIGAFEQYSVSAPTTAGTSGVQSSIIQRSTIGA